MVCFAVCLLALHDCVGVAWRKMRHDWVGFGSRYSCVKLLDCLSLRRSNERRKTKDEKGERWKTGDGDHWTSKVR